MQEADARKRAKPRADGGEADINPILGVADRREGRQRYQTLLQVAAGTRLRATTAEVDLA